MNYTIITVDYNNQHDQVQVNDVVSTTTSSFDYNGVNHCFDNDINDSVTVKAVHVDDDYSDFVQGKASTGGCYGYDYYRVIEIL